MDTMGQDREFSDEEKRFALNTVNNFREIWDATDRDNLKKDRDRKLKQIEFEKEFLDAETSKLHEEEEKQVEEFLQWRDQSVTDPKDHWDEETKDLMIRNYRIHFISRMFKEKVDWKRQLMAVKDFKVIKYGKVLQSILYLLGYERELICEPRSNKFFWKKAKDYINDDFIEQLDQYEVLGQKNESYLGYQTLNFIESNVSGISHEVKPLINKIYIGSRLIQHGIG